MAADETGELANMNVLVSVNGPVATLTLNRPDKRNAVRMSMWAAINAHVTALTEDPEVRILVVKGAGDHFCAGADISELTNGPHRMRHSHRKYRFHLRHHASQIGNCVSH